jgi:hypothetical protein
MESGFFAPECFARTVVVLPFRDTVTAKAVCSLLVHPDKTAANKTA